MSSTTRTARTARTRPATREWVPCVGIAWSSHFSFCYAIDEEPERPWPPGPRVSASGAWLLGHATPRRKRGGVPRPASAAVTYAATATLILLGLASSRRGSRTVSTPALYWALTLPASIVGGSANVRANEP